MKWRSKLGQILDTRHQPGWSTLTLQLETKPPSCLRIIPIVESNGNLYLNKQQNFQIIECLRWTTLPWSPHHLYCSPRPHQHQQ